MSNEKNSDAVLASLVGKKIEKLDYANVAENPGSIGATLSSLAGKVPSGLDKIAGGLGSILAIAELVNQLIGLFKKNEKRPAEPPVVTGPNGPVVVPPAPEPPPDTDPVERECTELRAKFYFIERKGKVLPKDQFERIIRREDPLQRGDRVHLDVSPYDVTGREIEPGSPALEQFVNRDTDPPSLRLRWLQPQDGVGEITNEYDDYGMTPVYKVPKNLEIGKQYELGTFALEFTREGTNDVVVSNELHSLRVRPWQE